MTQIEKAAPCQVSGPPQNNAAIVSPKLAGNNSTLTPRLRRLGHALLTGPKTVRDLLRLQIGNNVPEYVRRLRHEHGIEIDCEHIDFVTTDGDKSWYGLYTLTAEGREKLQALLASTNDE